jgi:hypothetical protein
MTRDEGPFVFPANLDPPKTWLHIVNRDELPRKI